MLTSEKTTLRRLVDNDVGQLATMANDRHISDSLRDKMPFPYAHSDAIKFIAMTDTEDPPQTFGVEYANQLCGVVGLVLQDDVYIRSAELGYWVGEEFWGRGIATSAVQQIVTYAFNDLDLIRVFAGIFEFNMASIRVLEKNGFQKEGVLRRAVLKHGKLLDEYRYARLRDDQL